MQNSRKASALAVASIAALALSSCASSDRDSEGSGGGDGDYTINFAAAGAPSTFDPMYATDGETFRITRQIFEGLVSFKPGTPDLAPGLATKWEPSEDGKTWTFDLREGVKFSDGTDFDAEAVCKNFERMSGQNEAGQQAAEYWASNMGAFGKSKDNLFQGCTEKGDNQVEIKLSRATSKFPALLGLPSWSMQSPTAMDKYKANDIKVQGEGFQHTEYAQKHPTGTGPFKFESYDVQNKTVTLVRNDDHWGDKAKPAKLVFKIMPDANSRKQALESGDIDGYDLPAPTDWASLKSAGMNVHIRDAFNILYIGLNPKKQPALKDKKVREALIHATNREQLVKTQLPEGATVATQWYPDTVDGFSKNVKKYEFDTAKAKSLLKEAGQENLEIEFWYPTEVSRPYMPDPQKIFQAIKSDWEKAGIKVKTVTKPWAGGYTTGASNGSAPAYLLGWTGDYNTPDNFIANFFLPADGAFGINNYPWGKSLEKQINDLDSIVDEGERDTEYQKLSEKLMDEYLPGIPVSNSPPAIVFGKNISGIVPSPLTSEDFSTAVKK